VSDKSQDARASVEQIEADLARDRERLAQTVSELTDRLTATKEQLSDKLDLKAQARATLAATRGQAKQRVAGLSGRVRGTASDPDQRAAAGAKVAPVLGGISAASLLAGVVRRLRS